SFVVERAIDDAADAPELRRFLYESLVLAVAFGLPDGPRWVRRFDLRLRERRTPPALRQSAVALCELVLAVGRLGRTLTRERVARIAWELLGGEAWVSNIRLSFALKTSDEEAAQKLGEADLEGARPVDLGYRYALLASAAARSGRHDVFFALHARANELLKKDGSLVSCLRRLNLEIDHGLVHSSRGDFHLAWQCFAEVLAFDNRFARRTIFASSAAHIVEICLLRGQPERARELLDRYEASLLASDPGPILRMTLHHLRAETALGERDERKARDALARAEALLGELPHEGFRATLLRTRARLEALDRSEEGYVRAFRLLDRSDAILEARGRSGLAELSLNLVTRGQFHLERREGERALECCAAGLEIARSYGFLPVWVRGFILKSYLLLETGRDTSESLYEQVLHELGLVRDPALLFEVIANLYLYTWNLEQAHLDLTDTHLKQLHRLREALEPEHFQDLYRRLVLRRVVERFERPREG
ncbi:MAG TPA: hypothetical protein VK116_03960, partial [Planctomycetota bacterium]|nr:hypothetical protein [Planctomycetota bacterium]